MRLFPVALGFLLIATVCSAQGSDAPPAGRLDLVLTPQLHIPTPSDVAVGFASEVGGRYRFSGLPVYSDATVLVARAGSTATTVDGTVSTVAGELGAGLW